MEKAEQIQTSPTFERRYWEALRRQSLAPDIGKLAIGGHQAEQWQNLERRRYGELTSGLGEALEGRVSTHYRFELRGGKLVAEDGQPLEEMLEEGLQDAIRLASRDSFYVGFLPQRARHELDEVREQQAMALGETKYNTIATFSPYSEEFATSEEATQKLRHAAQKPYWQRGMFRLSHWDGQELHIFTRSIDNSSVGLLKKTGSHYFGHHFKSNDSTEMLGERIHLKIDDDSWQAIADSVAAEADKLLAERQGGKWHQGRPETSSGNMQAYVESQTDIIDGLLAAEKRLASQHSSFGDYQKAFDEKIYDCIALLEKRLELGKTGEPIGDFESASSGAGATARAEGKSYDMCGHVLSVNNSQAAAGEQTGFESLKRFEGKAVKCPFCRSQVKVPKQDLDKGHLYCKDCDTGVDVCTGETFHKGRKIKQQAEKDLFDPITKDLAEIDLKLKQQKAA